MKMSITVEALKFCKANERDYLWFLLAGYKIIGLHPFLIKLVNTGYANYIDGSHTKNYKTKDWKILEMP